MERRESFNVEMGGKEFLLRPVGIADTQELRTLDLVCFPPERAYTEGYFLLLFLYHDAFGWVLEDDGRIAAFILLTCSAARGHISTIDVHPDYRRIGLASRLMGLAEDSVREMGAGDIILQVEAGNEAAKALYSKLGYILERRLPKYYEDGSDGYLMRKKLDRE